MTPNRTRAILVGGFVVGLVIRCLNLGYRGMFDMVDYMRWGEAAFNVGLAHAYLGMHFPLQYQMYEACWALARALGVTPFIVFKAANLPFEAGTFLVIVSLLGRAGRNPLYALVYWLHPWFLIFFNLGYVDSQMAFCIVLAIWLIHDDARARDYAIAGIPLAAAALLKPQATLPCVGLAMYAAMVWVRTRRFDAAWIFAPLAAGGLAYEAYFTRALWPDLGLRAVALLPMSVLRVGSFMPALTDHMLNIWYPLAYALKAPDADIWTVSSKFDVLPHVQLRFIALLMTLAVIAWYSALVAWTPRRLSASDRVRYILTFATLIVPAIMTSAHENHLFIATVLLVPLLANSTAAARWAIHTLLLIQLVNIEGLYGLDRFADWLRPIYSFEIRTALSVVAVAAFAVVARQLYQSVAPDAGDRAAILGGAGG
jgi:hypothetical protein